MPKVSEAHRAARREQILGATLRCVAREGFHKTTMAAVIRESGLSAGAVYLYFKGKEDLIRAIAQVAVSGVAVAVDELVVADRVVPPALAMERATARIVELGVELDVELPRLAVQAWAEAARDPEVLALLRSEAERIRAAWRSYVERAIEAGHLPATSSPEPMAQVLTGMLPGFMLQRLIFGDVDPASYAAGLDGLLGGRASE
jgi:AcrR family transcriptional regulator